MASRKLGSDRIQSCRPLLHHASPLTPLGSLLQAPSQVGPLFHAHLAAWSFFFCLGLNSSARLSSLRDETRSYSSLCPSTRHQTLFMTKCLLNE